MMKILIPLIFTLVGVNGQNKALCTDVELNADFELNDTYPTHWNDTVGDTAVTMKIVEGELGGNALEVTNRLRWWASPRLDLSPSCYEEGEELTFTARVKLMDDKMNATECTPGQPWGRHGETWVCPLMTLRITDWQDEVSYAELGSIVAPYNPEWNSMYGTYIVTPEFLNATSVSLVWYKFDKGMWFTLDEVKISRVTEGCEVLLKNGGGEAGDTRGWQYYGNDGIEYSVATDENFTIGDFHFVSSKRVDYDDGIKTDLDPNCLDLDSLYEISAKVRLSDVNGTNVTCDYLGTSTSGSEIPRCPMVYIGARNPGGPRQFRPIASMDNPFDVDGWNELSSLFGFFSNELTSEELFLFISGSPPGIDILIDDVALARFASNTHAPSMIPSASPSASGEPSVAPTMMPTKGAGATS